ncbi:MULTISPECIES: sugar diacid recognition domain-containing protein [Vibrio]|uniref:CdaR family transcriptional regulator n=1 Tax=Vibrio diazotrophicus TaxID=685 RepID=A0A329EBK5_VIBDI|nr:sugar diacid recognition domain-containing protein [Vibrio diazotrophicus]PNI01952.1 XRE family transcriptional regulator [Vibrio diazotrophicus]RAS66547.1 CdaR family transcriptional regulator [Vibrio diazotrophicus]
MKLNETIARQIVERTMKIIPYSVNVMDEQGRIIGSGDPSRLQQKHEGAVLASTERRVVEIDQATSARLKGVKPGINLPIVHHEQVLGVVGISGEPSQVHHYGELVKMTAELIVEQAELMEQVQWDKRHREELVMQLISAEESDEQKLTTIAQRLDIDINEPRIATIIKLIALDDNTLTLEHMQHLVHLLEYPERNNLVGILSVSEHEVVVLKPASVIGDEWNPDKERQRVKSLLKRINKEAGFRVRVAVGDYFPGINGLTRSYQSAKTTLQVTRKLKGTIFFFHDNQLPVLLSAMQYQNWQREKLLTPLLELQKHDRQGMLQKTIETYLLLNCDPAKTCQELHIHRNTLRYRLDKINENISLDINKLEDKIHLYLALKLY